MKYLKKFTNHIGYEAYIVGSVFPETVSNIINGNLKRKPIRTGFSLFLDSLMKLLIVMPSMIRAQTAMAAIIAIGTFGSGSPAYTVKPMMPKIRSANSAMVHMAKKVYCNAFINTTYH